MKDKTMVLKYVFLIIFAVLLQACTSGSNSFGTSATKQMEPGEFGQVATSTSKGISPAAAETANKIFAKSAGSEANPADYKIAGLDVLDVTVLGVPELTRTVQVSTGGTITLPLIKAVKASGRTQGELERDIANKLSTTYLNSPQVSVFIKEYNSQKVTVDGAVQKPGIFSKQGDMSLLQAIAQAQGLTTVADPTGVLIFRTVDHKRLAARFDIRKVRGGILPDPMLEAGDIVMVDENNTKTTLRDIVSAMPLSGLFTLIPLL
jgi:polysaccharide biosynthesis/export protein